MNFLDLLNTYGDDEINHYHKFRLQYFEEKTIHLFFEGDDDQSFYMNFILNIFTNQNPCIYICEGKSNVYQIYSDIDWTVYRKCKALFFTDKDFDDIIGKVYPIEQNIFVTKYYSIENYAVNKKVLERFIRDIYYINQQDLINPFLQKFEEAHTQFSKQILSLISWLILNRKEGKKASFKNINLDDIFCIQNFEFKRKKGVRLNQYLSSKTNVSFNKSICKDLLQIIRALQSVCEPKFYLRGKFELWLIFTFLNEVKKYINTLNEDIKKFNKDKPKNEQKPKFKKIHQEMKFENFWAIIAPRVCMPNELSDFLKLNCNNAQP